MQYTVAHIAYNGEPWLRDVVEQALCEIGFETFDGDDAYIQTALYNEQALRAVLAEYKGVQLLGVEACPDENWNATWEAEHPMEELPLGVRIIPHCAFGAGHHETTGMMIAALINATQSQINAHSANKHEASNTRSVLDMGCGTGVLGIMALRCGAEHVTFVDIDDKSTENTLENIKLNFTNSYLADARTINSSNSSLILEEKNFTNSLILEEKKSTNSLILEERNYTILCQGTVPAGEYDLILANIHRNILLSQMADYARCLRPNGQLWISGFYENDIAPLREEAERQGLHFLETHANGDWRMCQFYKP